MPTEFAPIPPTSLIDMCSDFRMQFCLIHELEFDQDYRLKYAAMGRSDDHYLIMDNGTYETGVPATLPVMKHWIDFVKPSEVILPDRMFFAEETLKMSERAFGELSSSSNINYMGVPHGRTLAEWLWCLDKFVEMGVDVIGIPKNYGVWSGGRRILRALVPRDVPIHYLGMNEEDWKDPMLKSIRSVDSAKPFLVGYKRRPVDYFARPADKFQRYEERLRLYKEAFADA